MLSMEAHKMHAQLYSGGNVANNKTPLNERDAGDPELEARVKKVTEKFSECIHIVANEPSLGLFRIQEHVRKSLPHLAHTKMELGIIQQKVQGSCYDVDYAVRAMDSMEQSKRPLSSIETMLKSAIITKRHLNDRVTDRWVILDTSPRPLRALTVSCLMPQLAGRLSDSGRRNLSLEGGRKSGKTASSERPKSTTSVPETTSNPLKQKSRPVSSTGVHYPRL